MTKKAGRNLWLDRLMRVNQFLVIVPPVQQLFLVVLISAIPVAARLVPAVVQEVVVPKFFVAQEMAKDRI